MLRSLETQFASRRCFRGRPVDADLSYVLGAPDGGALVLRQVPPASERDRVSTTIKTTFGRGGALPPHAPSASIDSVSTSLKLLQQRIGIGANFTSSITIYK